MTSKKHISSVRGMARTIFGPSLGVGNIGKGRDNCQYSATNSSYLSHTHILLADILTNTQQVHYTLYILLKIKIASLYSWLV